MIKTPFFIFKLINNVMILTSHKGSWEMRNIFSQQVLFFHTTDSQTFYKVALEEGYKIAIGRVATTTMAIRPVSFGRATPS